MLAHKSLHYNQKKHKRNEEVRDTIGVDRTFYQPEFYWRKLKKEEIINQIESCLKEMFERSCANSTDKFNFLNDVYRVGQRLIEAEPSIPEQAPEFWLERKDRTEVAPDFIRRVWGSWLGHGLTQADIRRRDKSLYMALHKWLKSNHMPADLDLPTQKEANDRRLEAAGLSPDPRQIDEQARERMRLAEIARHRGLRVKRGEPKLSA